MSIFNLYFKLGFQHISDLKGYDHILFLLALCAVYSLKEWSKVLILVTAFTLGHTLTLALATLNYLVISSNLIELLIPITILVTAVINISFNTNNYSKNLHKLKYATALFFGLIHGLGFSIYLKSLLGFKQNIIKPLFAFNLGLEIGQVAIVLFILFLGTFFTKYLNMKKHDSNFLISGACIGVSAILIIERIQFFEF